MSNFFKINLKDVAKGLIVAILSAVLTGLYQALSSQVIIDPKQLFIIGLTAGLGYLIKNFFTDKDGKLGGIF